MIFVHFDNDYDIFLYEMHMEYKFHEGNGHNFYLDLTILCSKEKNHPLAHGGVTER